VKASRDNVDVALRAVAETKRHTPISGSALHAGAWPIGDCATDSLFSGLTYD
jgi:hypothetical protein